MRARTASRILADLSRQGRRESCWEREGTLIGIFRAGAYIRMRGCAPLTDEGGQHG